jgi:hypothetical protein
MSWILGVLGSADGTLRFRLTGRCFGRVGWDCILEEKTENHARKTEKKPRMYLVHAMTVTLLLYDMISYHIER